MSLGSALQQRRLGYWSTKAGATQTSFHVSSESALASWRCRGSGRQRYETLGRLTVTNNQGQNAFHFLNRSDPRTLSC